MLPRSHAELWLDEIVEHHELGLATTPPDKDVAWSGTVAGAGLLLHSAQHPSREALADALIEKLRDALPNVCDSCLGCRSVPSDYTGVLASCGDCLGGRSGTTDAYTDAQRAHDWHRNHQGVR
jgi:hypothetical protein